LSFCLAKLSSRPSVAAPYNDRFRGQSGLVVGYLTTSEAMLLYAGIAVWGDGGFLALGKRPLAERSQGQVRQT